MALTKGEKEAMWLCRLLEAIQVFNAELHNDLWGQSGKNEVSFTWYCFDMGILETHVTMCIICLTHFIND